PQNFNPLKISSVLLTNQHRVFFSSRIYSTNQHRVFYLQFTLSSVFGHFFLSSRSSFVDLSTIKISNRVLFVVVVIVVVQLLF
ncbi:unnamed protein product, partial [Oikopleura dioica]